MLRDFAKVEGGVKRQAGEFEKTRGQRDASRAEHLGVSPLTTEMAVVPRPQHAVQGYCSHSWEVSIEIQP